MSQIWKKMKKSEMRKTFSGEKVFHFMLKKQLSKVKKNRDKININHSPREKRSSVIPQGEERFQSVQRRKFPKKCF